MRAPKASAILALSMLVALNHANGEEGNDPTPAQKSESRTDQRALDNQLAPPERILADGEPIDVPGFAAPWMTDVDGDGRADLLVGQMDHGRLRIYSNTGTPDQPTFDNYRFFRAGGVIAGVPSGCLVGFTPCVVDFNRDGRDDILTGSFYGAAVFRFDQKQDGSYDEGLVLVGGDGEVNLSPRKYNSTVFPWDWDRDGDYDLLVGRTAVHLVINDGTDAEPVYREATKLQVNGNALPSGRIGPVVADWDGDGIEDLLIGVGKDLVWYRNTTKVGEPVFEDKRVLISGETFVEPQMDGSDRDRVSPTRMIAGYCVCDYDNDGDQDLLVGDHCHVRRKLDDAQVAIYREASAARSEFLSGYRRLLKDVPDQSRVDVVAGFRAALQDWNKLGELHFTGPYAASPSFERYGGVWLYRRQTVE